LGDVNTSTLTQLLDKHFDLFPDEDAPISTIPRSVAETSIATEPNAQGPKSKPRPLALAEKLTVRKELQKMLSMGIIRPSNSPSIIYTVIRENPALAQPGTLKRLLQKSDGSSWTTP
jgi:hypothetical protein